jgi:hypothetical protein
MRAQVNNYHKASSSNTALAVERHTGMLGSGNEQWARKSCAQRHQAGQQARLQSATRTSSTRVCRLTTAHDKCIVTRHYRLPVKSTKGRMRNRTGDNGAWLRSDSKRTLRGTAAHILASTVCHTRRKQTYTGKPDDRRYAARLLTTAT